MAGPTDLEQLLLELINEARLNPVKNATRYISSYGPLRSNDASVQAALNAFGVSGADLQKALSQLIAASPLAWNDSLGSAAEKHSAAMIGADTQSHQLPGERSLLDRLTAEGYQARGAAENVYAYASSPLHAHAGFMVDWGNGPGGMQSPAGHRGNIMNGSYNEIGIDITAVTGSSKNVGPFVVTQDLASRGKHFILGVAYSDNDNNQFYSLGEGRGDLVIKLAGKSVTSAASGGYTIEAPDGPGLITLTGGGLAGEVTVKTVGASTNLKLDVVNGNTLLTSGSISVEGPISELRVIGIWGVTLNVGAGDQTVVGGEAGDEINTGDGNDTLRGSGGSDVLNAGAGDDVLEGGSGNDTLNGGEGKDTAVFAANRSAYTVTAEADGSLVLASARTGKDIAKSIEVFRFADGDYVWNGKALTLQPPTVTNRAPTVSGDQAITLDEDTSRQVTVTASDADGDPLTFTAGLAANGTVTGGQNGVFTYTPKAHFHGTDSFIVTVADGKGGTATFTATLTVASVNDAPTAAANQNVATTAGASKVITVAASDADGDTVTYAAGAAGHGAVSGGSNGVFTYKPTAGYVGKDSFTVNISDGKGGTTAQVINITISEDGAVVDKPGFQAFTSTGFAGVVGGQGTVFGGNGLQDITVWDVEGEVTFDVSFNRGGDIIRLPGAASEFLIYQEASAVVLEKGGLTVTIPFGSAGMPLVFEDGTRTLVYDSTKAAVVIGNQIVTEAAAPITAPAATGPASSVDPAAESRIFLKDGGDAALGGDFNVFGTSGSEKVTFVSGDLVLDPTFNKGGDTIHLLDPASSFTAQLVNSVVVLTSSDGTVTIPIGPNGITLDFDGDERTLVYDTATSTLRIGDQAIGETAVPLGSTLPPGTSGQSLDVGSPTAPLQINLDTSKHYVLQDNAERSGYATVKGFGNDDVIQVSNAVSRDYNFGTGDADKDGASDDLLLTFSEGGIVNTVAILDVIRPGIVVFDEATAEAAAGWNFITFG